MIAHFINTVVSPKESENRAFPEVNMEDTRRIYLALFSHHALSLSVFKLATPYQLSVIVDTLYPSLFPSFTILPSSLEDNQTLVQQRWNLLLQNTSPLRVSFVIHTLLSLLRLYINKQSNNDTIAVLRKILAVVISQHLQSSLEVSMNWGWLFTLFGITTNWLDQQERVSAPFIWVKFLIMQFIVGWLQDHYRKLAISSRVNVWYLM